MGTEPAMSRDESVRAAPAEAVPSSVAIDGPSLPAAHHAVSATDTTKACAASNCLLDRVDLKRGRPRSLDIVLTKPSTSREDNAW